MRIIFGLILLGFFNLSYSSESYSSTNEMIFGWGIEVNFSGKKDSYEFYSYVQPNGESGNALWFRAPHSKLQYNSFSCVPDANDKNEECSIDWRTKMIYLLSIPASLYIADEIFNN